MNNSTLKSLGSNRPQSAFTILELLITIALLGILLGLAVPSFLGFIERQSIRAEADRYTKTFNNARMQAMTSEIGATTVCWNPTDAARAAEGGAAADSVPARSVAVFDGNSTVGYGERISTTSVAGGNSAFFTTAANSCFSFNSQGRLAGGAAVAIAICQEAGESIDSQRIEIGVSGRVVTRLNSSTQGLGVQNCSA